MPSLEPNIYNLNPVITQAEPIFVQNLGSFNVPASTVTVLNTNLNNDNNYLAPATPGIYLPMDEDADEESSYLDVLQLDLDDLRQIDWLEESKSDDENQGMHEMTDDWCHYEKVRIARICEATRWIGEMLDDGVQPPRKMGSKCSSEFCKKSSKRHCFEISDRMREEIFNFFWQQLNWIQRKVYVCDLIKVCPSKQNRTPDAQYTSPLYYFLRVNGRTKSVCKKMFINTIGIGEHTFRQWMNQVQLFESIPAEVMNTLNTKENATSKANAPKAPECVFESKQQASPDYWIRDKVKKARERGEAYIGYSVRASGGKTGRRSYGRMPREQRSLGPACDSPFCERSTKRQCAQFTEEIRQNIFDRFWKILGWDERKAFIIESVDIMQPKRRTCIDEKSSRRGVTCLYFLCIDGQRYNICRRLFLNTLGIKEATVQYWLMHSNTTEPTKKRENSKIEDANGNDNQHLLKSKRLLLPDQ